MTTRARPRLNGNATLGARALVAAILAASMAACTKGREESTPDPTWDQDVQPLFAAKCVQCHGDTKPSGGWRANVFLGAIACVENGAPATLPENDTAPLIAAIRNATHAGILDADQSALVARWVSSGTPQRREGVHAPAWGNPRSPDFHGRYLRSKRWAPMLDGNDPEACGRCHDGAPARPDGVTRGAPTAPACTSCHTEPEGPLACGTCHGQGSNPLPPRDPCFFPDDQAGAHAKHVTPQQTHAEAFPCSMCHPVPDVGKPIGVHANGDVEIIFDETKVVGEKSFERDENGTVTCAVYCHDQGGQHPRPKWTDSDLTCNSCHTSPPQNHFPGPCTKCHHEPNADGTALAGGSFHLNGKIDLGDGSGKCGACHGNGDSPWPSKNAHPAHMAPSLTVPVDCTTCHPPHDQIMSPLHLDGTVEVHLGGRALARNSQPVWDGTSCKDVACHGNGLIDEPKVVPQWKDPSGAAKTCGACHPIPPSQHTADVHCERVECHGGEVERVSPSVLRISADGKSLHINGAINHAGSELGAASNVYHAGRVTERRLARTGERGAPSKESDVADAVLCGRVDRRPENEWIEGPRCAQSATDLEHRMG